MSRVLVTGANGHLGANIVRSLLRQGHGVIAFVRHNSDLRGLAGLNVTYHYGDVRDQASLMAACEGCDTAIHTAAVYNIWAKQVDDIMQPALVGSRNIIQVAQAHSLRRLIYTSSVAAVGYTTTPGQLLNESHWNEDGRNPYFQAKLQSEQETARLAAELGVPTIRFSR
jgi:dihydroflavonol-4-reductase